MLEYEHRLRCLYYHSGRPYLKSKTEGFSPIILLGPSRDRWALAPPEGKKPMLPLQKKTNLVKTQIIRQQTS